MTMIPKNNEISKTEINHVEVTKDKLTSRGGLLPLAKYVSKVGIIDMMERHFNSIKGSRKGYSIPSIFQQMFMFFSDGTDLSLTRFDELKRDFGYSASIETPEEQMISSHQAKRFLGSFNHVNINFFRKILQNLFMWRLKILSPEVIYIMVDTMVADNSDAHVREGVQPTYKKGVKGFQPLHFIWNGYIVDLVFRGGKKHSNHGNTVSTGIKHLVEKIRAEYSGNVPIVFLLDRGFFDDRIYTTIEELGAYYIAGGKQLPFVREELEGTELSEFGIYGNERQTWRYREFLYSCKKWKISRRAIYTTPVIDEGGNFLLEFGDSERVILTNIHADSLINQVAPAASSPVEIIYRAHSSGTHELVHRSIKEFGTEKLPMKRFLANSAFYNLMVLSHNLFRAFTEDVLVENVPGLDSGSYANTIRRKFLDIAGKIVRTGHRTIMKITEAVYSTLNFSRIWILCNSPVPMRT